MIIAILLVAFNILFWIVYFVLFSRYFYRLKKFHVFYSFRDGLLKKRLPVLLFYAQNLTARIMVSIMIGISSSLSKSDNEWMWLVISGYCLISCLNTKVFKSEIENFNMAASNGLIFIITFVFLFF